MRLPETEFCELVNQFLPAWLVFWGLCVSVCVHKHTVMFMYMYYFNFGHTHGVQTSISVAQDSCFFWTAVNSVFGSFFQFLVLTKLSWVWGCLRGGSCIWCIWRYFTHKLARILPYIDLELVFLCCKAGGFQRTVWSFWMGRFGNCFATLHCFLERVQM